MNRRILLEQLAGIPLVKGLFASGTPFAAAASPPTLVKSNLVQELGVGLLINARGTVTFLSGSLVEPEVLAAINGTAHDFADMHEVEDKVGERIAEMLNCEAAIVTSGAA